MLSTKNTITVEADGPLLLTGDIEIRGSGGEMIARKRDVALCRCGASKNKPFCDGSHETAGFRDPGRVEDEKAQVVEADGTRLTVTCRANAMLIAKGPMTIRSGDGSTETTRNKAALCRCGKSNNRPFCDASHKRCGFVAS
jgi:CDGSH-type Zn-finger protein